MALKEGQHDKSDKWHYVPINMSSSDVITSSSDVVTTGAKDRPDTHGSSLLQGMQV